MIELASHSPEDSEKIAKRVADFFIQHTVFESLKSPTIITLEGELGAGKTLFSRALIHQISAVLSSEKLPLVTSPTYHILNHYPLPIPITHIDCYRLSHEMELENIGIRDYLNKKGLVIIEWASKLDCFWKKSHLHIDIVFLHNLEKRVLQFTIDEFYSTESKQLLTQWLQ